MAARFVARTSRSWLVALVSISTATGLAVAAGPDATAAPGGHRLDTSITTSSHADRTEGLKPAYDARAGGTPAARRAIAHKAAVTSSRPATEALRKSLGREGVLEIDGLTGTPRQVVRLNGFLTARSKAPAARIAMGYVRAHHTAFGLRSSDFSTFHLRRDYVDVAGIHHLSWVQRAGGVALFGNGLQANVTRNGRLLSVLGSPVSGLRAVAADGSVARGPAAIRAARGDLGERSRRAGPADHARAVLFQTPSGTRRGWETITMSAEHPALHVIDDSGRVLFRRSLGSDAAPAKDPADGVAFDYFPGASAGGTPHPVDYTAKGWLPASASTLDGNNAHTYADVNDDNVVNRGEEIPPRTGNSWDYRLAPFQLADVSFCDNPWPCSWNPDVPFSWQTNRNQNATQVFTFVNNWHDHLAASPIGFTEAAGNFQAKNSTRSGKPGDAVQAQTDDGASIDNGLPDGSHVDNANMDTPPDGQAPRMQMYLQHQPGTTYPDGDPFSPTNVGDEADTVYHEYTHGLSNRLVVDASGRSTLGDFQAGAMGEAWSDWYAQDYLVAQKLVTDSKTVGDLVIFPYDGEGVSLDRTEPMDCQPGQTSSRCPGTPGAGKGGYTYGDYGKIVGGPEVHGDSEIWSQTLWDLRSRIGSAAAESIVTRAMSLSPANPSYLDERNAILSADQAVFGGSHHDAIWSVFARRGMGFFAASLNGNDTQPGEDFSLPPAPGSATGTLTGVVTQIDSGQPLAGATVVIASPIGGTSTTAVTGADGRYTLTGLPVGTYPKVVASAPGYDGITTAVTVVSGTTTRNFALQKDWLAASGGATVTAFDGPDFSPDCGPGFAIDQSRTTGWGSTADLVNGLPGPNTPKAVTIRLPQAVDVAQFAVDPSATCGDAGSASTGDYRLETSTDGTTWNVASEGTFTVAQRGTLVSITPAAGSGNDVLFVRFTMITPQVFQVGSCPGNFSGCDFMDMSEIEAFGSAAQ
jgi:hypothetical protein